MGADFLAGAFGAAGVAACGGRVVSSIGVGEEAAGGAAGGAAAALGAAAGFSDPVGAAAVLGAVAFATAAPLEGFAPPFGLPGSVVFVLLVAFALGTVGGDGASLEGGGATADGLGDASGFARAAEPVGSGSSEAAPATGSFLAATGLAGAGVAWACVVVSFAAFSAAFFSSAACFSAAALAAAASFCSWSAFWAAAASATSCWLVALILAFSSITLRKWLPASVGV